MTDTINQIDEDFNGSKMVLQNDKMGIRYLFDEYQERRIQAALTVLQKIASGDDWFEIETALKDGTTVILHRKSKIQELTHSFSGLYQDDKWWVVEGLEFANPTHWKPLEGATHIKMLMEKELNDGK